MTRTTQYGRVKFERFESKSWGFITAGRDRRMIANAQSDAETWMAENLDKEILSIDTTCTQFLACVTVWYREPQHYFDQTGI